MLKIRLKFAYGAKNTFATVKTTVGTVQKTRCTGRGPACPGVHATYGARGRPGTGTGWAGDSRRAGGKVLVNFKSIGTAALSLGAKRGSAVPIFLKLTSRRGGRRGGGEKGKSRGGRNGQDSNPFRALSAIKKVEVPPITLSGTQD